MKDPYSIIKEDIENCKWPYFGVNVWSVGEMDKFKGNLQKDFELKYFKYMTDQNFQKLFCQLIDITISKKTDELMKNQERNFFVLDALFKYLNKKGEKEILRNQYKWSRVDKDVLYIEKEYSLENWHALTYLYEILIFDKSFLSELEGENELVFNFIKNELYSHSKIFLKYWELFDNDINIAIDRLDKNLSNNEYLNIINELYLNLNYEKIYKLLERVLKNVPTVSGYNEADVVMEVLIRVLRDRRIEFSQKDCEKLFKILNENSQFYYDSRNARDRQIKAILDLDYDLSSFENLKIEQEDENEEDDEFNFEI